MLEGTGKYFLMLLAIVFIVFLTVKICLGKIFKTAKLPAWKAYIPFYNRLILTDLLELKRSLFFKTLIPLVNLYYYNIIIKELLKAYQMDEKESIWFIIIPMYKFPELIFKKPKYMKGMYNNTEQFINNQNILFEKNTAPINEVVITKETYNQINNMAQTKNEKTNIAPPSYNQIEPKPEESVFLNQNLEPDERKETIIEAKHEEKVQTAPINVDKSKPKVCPNCGTKLSPSAQTCFLCGTKLL